MNDYTVGNTKGVDGGRQTTDPIPYVVGNNGLRYGGISSVKEGDLQLDCDIYKPRTTGRFSNKLCEIIIWILKSIKDNKQFETDYVCEYPFDTYITPQVSIDDNGKTRISKSKVKVFVPYIIEAYPHNYWRYYHKNMDIIRNMFPNVKKVLKKTDDVVIHLRLDDIFNQLQSYTLLPMSFYRNIIKKLPITAVGQRPTVKFIGRAEDQVQKSIVRYIVNEFVKNGIKCEVFLDRTITEDLIDILNCEYFVGSSSTFWMWPLLLNENLKKAYIPRVIDRNGFRWDVVNTVFDENLPNTNFEYINVVLDSKIKKIPEFLKG